MNDMKKNIRQVFWLYFCLFLMVVLYLGNFILNSYEVVNSSYNPRLNVLDKTIKRGNIYDSGGIVIAKSDLTGSEYSRNYPFENIFAHTAGAIGKTKSGVEAKYNFYLQGLDFEIIQRSMNLVSDSPLKGNDVYLTINSDLQQYIYNQMDGLKGGVVVMEPKTGKILSMVSFPSYNPNHIAENWDDLSTDEINSPLINRASQGLYPPGSIYKIITASAALDNIPDINDFHYECVGYAYFGESKIRCFNETAHGTVNLQKAIEVSCNTFFSQVAMEIGPEVLREYSEKAMFNANYGFDLEYVKSKFSLEKDSIEGEIIQTSIGQGKTLTTPLHMAMLVSSVANDGKMMEPFVCEKVVSSWGFTKMKGKQNVLSNVFTKEQANMLKDMMVTAVDTGTGKGAAISGIKIAGKTGTAENASGDAHGWFMAFAPADDPKYAIAIVTENTDGTKKALAISKNIFGYLLNE